MNAIDVIERLCNKKIIKNKLQYCLVDSTKKPFKIDNTLARPNIVDDFVNFEKLLDCNNLKNYSSLGISIQASNICAIDVDHCFSEKNNILSADERAKNILDIFKDVAYCEFSFSGTGLRILFKTNIIDDYSKIYYIKNEKNHIEYYQPSNSFRYVTITGNTIFDNDISSSIDSYYIYEFLNKFMKREYKNYEIKTCKKETKSYDELMKIVKKLYFKDNVFQDLWFDKAPGSGKDESERDYHLIAYLFENVTQDKIKLKQIFETSIFFKTKDYKHVYKWNYNDFRYYNYLYNRISNN